MVRAYDPCNHLQQGLNANSGTFVGWNWAVGKNAEVSSGWPSRIHCAMLRGESYSLHPHQASFHQEGYEFPPAFSEGLKALIIQYVTLRLVGRGFK